MIGMFAGLTGCVRSGDLGGLFKDLRGLRPSVAELRLGSAEMEVQEAGHVGVVRTPPGR